MSRDELHGSQVILAAIAAYAGLEMEDIAARIRLAVDGGSVTAADPHAVTTAVEAVIRRVRLAPISFETKQSVLNGLQDLQATPWSVMRAELDAWQRLVHDLRPAIVEVVCDPVVLPPMSAGQEAAWHAVLDLEMELRAHWCLIGGQMVVLICVEHNVDVIRPTEDADVVLGVWIERNALKEASRVLDQQGFLEDQTHDGYGYRYRRGDASVDLLLPENVTAQIRVPKTTTGRPGLEVPGGNQALTRAEKVPVQVGNRLGHVRRPNMLGALVAKAAAALVDCRDTDRHRDDIAVLGQIALDSGLLRRMANMIRDKDRRRLREALVSMPGGHTSWRLINDPVEVRAALARLSAAL